MACSKTVRDDEIKVTTKEYPRWILCWECIAEILELESEEAVHRFLLSDSTPYPTPEEYLKVSVDILAEKVIDSDEFSLKQKDTIMLIADAMSDDWNYINWMTESHNKNKKILKDRIGASYIEEILKRLSANE